MNIHSAQEKVLTFERVFDAPRELVFALWIDPKHLIRWYGPRGHSLRVCESDLKVGGRWRFCMNRGEEDFWVWGTYHEILAPEKLIFSSSMDFHRYETLVTIHFEDLGDRRTLMRFKQAEFMTVSDCQDHSWGWASAMEVLGEYLIRMHTAGMLNGDLWNEPRREAVAEDYAEAARLAGEERENMPDRITPPSAKS